MKNILIVLLIFISIVSFGQETTNDLQKIIKAKVEYNNYGLYHTLVARIWNVLGSQYFFNYLRLKTVDSPYNPPVVPSGITSRSFWINKKKKDEIIRDFVRTNDWELQSRPYSSTRRLKGYRFDVEFWWKVNSWDPSYDNLMIECHKY